MVIRKTRSWGVVALLGCAFLLAACETPAGGEAGSPFGPGQPGRYSVGDRFTFDNPILTWSVISVEGEKVFWRSDRGDEQVTGHDPLLPALEWKNPDKGGGRRSITDLKGSLFPLTSGNRMTFTSNVESWGGGDAGDEAGKWQYGWSCNIAGEEEIEVQAGSFDTFKILCGRVKPDELVFYYAPKIGHYVVMRIDDPANKSTITRNLVSFSRIALGGSPLPEDMAMIPPSPPSPPPAPVVPQPTTPAPKPVPAPPPPAVAAGGGPRVHIASFSSEENATRGWGIFQRENTALLGGLKSHVVRADLGSRGVYFRLMTQRLQDRAAARDLCRKLKARGVGCRVTSR